MAAVYGELTGHRDLIAFDGGTTASSRSSRRGGHTRRTSFRASPGAQRAGQRAPDEHPGDRLVEIGPRGARSRERRSRDRRRPESASSRPARSATGAARRDRHRATSLGLHQPRLFRWRLDQAPGGRRGAAIGRARTSPRLTLEEAAWGVHAIVTPTWSSARRIVSIERGRDPARPDLRRVRGLGPVHGCAWPRPSDPRAILPAAAGVTAAIGLLPPRSGRTSRDVSRRLDAVEPAAVTPMYDEMAAQRSRSSESAVAGEVTWPARRRRYVARLPS